MTGQPEIAGGDGGGCGGEIAVEGLGGKGVVLQLLYLSAASGRH